MWWDLIKKGGYRLLRGPENPVPPPAPPPHYLLLEGKVWKGGWNEPPTSPRPTGQPQAEPPACCKSSEVCRDMLDLADAAERLRGVVEVLDGVVVAPLITDLRWVFWSRWSH